MVILALGMLVFSSCGSDAEYRESGGENSDGNVQAAALAPGSKGSLAPDFTLKRIAGGNLQLSSLRGKAVIVDFWDTWCPPCIKALPHLQELSETYSDDLVVVGVAMGREGEEKVRAFVKKHGLTFTMVLFDNDPQLISDFGGIQSIPTTFLIDGDGVIREKWVGAFGKAEYERAIRSVIGS